MSTHRNGSRHGSQKDRLERLLANTQRELETLAELPDEPEYEEAMGPTVIRFDLQYAETQRLYSFAAIRIGDLWYLAGGLHISPLSWDDLMDYIHEGNYRLVGEIWLVNGYVAL